MINNFIRLHRCHKDDGGVTIIAIGICALALALFLGLADLGGASSLRGRAQNAADAASLSAAYDISHFKPGSACSSARTAAAKNGAELQSCDATGNEVEVVVEISDNGRTTKAKARAYVK